MQEERLKRVAELIRRKHSEMEQAGALTSQQGPTIPRSKNTSQLFLAPDPSSKPPDWECPRCRVNYPPLWNYVKGWWAESDCRLYGHDICTICRDKDLKQWKDQLSFEAAVKSWKLDTGDYTGMRFESYRPQNESQALALKIARGHIRKMSGNGHCGFWLWSHGYGVGKTHLLVSALWEAARLGHTIAFYDEPGLLSAIRDTYNGNDKSDKSIIEQAKSAHVFGMDDLGRGYVRAQSIEWYQDIMYQILNERYNVSRPTLVTSNMSPDRLGQRLGGAAYSRLCGLCPRPIQVSGEDYRLRRE